MERDISVELGRAIIGINRTKKQIMDKRLDKLGIAGPSHLIIAAAKKHPGCSQDFISEFFVIGKAAVARGAQKLEDMGLLRREVSSEDRRQNKLYLTQSGEEAYVLVSATLAEWEQCLTDGFTEEELETAKALLSRMLEASKRHLNKPAE